MNAGLFICAAGLAFFAAVLCFYLVKISARKKFLEQEKKPVPKASSSFTGSLVLCALVEIMPLLVPLGTAVVAILCLCGIFGAYIVLKDRLENL
ncbi:hypothetical protein [Treponema sp.]|uniref:hypothetical protein n=1 Tax=Treponema sp. TaxID=166 RepID=UPI003F088DE7